MVKVNANFAEIMQLTHVQTFAMENITHINHITHALRYMPKVRTTHHLSNHWGNIVTAVNSL